MTDPDRDPMQNPVDPRIEGIENPAEQFAAILADLGKHAYRAGLEQGASLQRPFLAAAGLALMLSGFSLGRLAEETWPHAMNEIYLWGWWVPIGLALGYIVHVMRKIRKEHRERAE